eukprot:4152738-Pyramimonas_sp.AAC.1
MSLTTSPQNVGTGSARTIATHASRTREINNARGAEHEGKDQRTQTEWARVRMRTFPLGAFGATPCGSTKR